MSQKMAQGTSIGALLLPVGVLAAMKYHKDGFLDIKIALIDTVFLTLGAFGGAQIVSILPEQVMRKSFGVLLGAVALHLLFT